MTDIHGEIVKAALHATRGDTTEWDVASEAERDEMRSVAAALEPVIRRTVERIAEWHDGLTNPTEEKR